MYGWLYNVRHMVEYHSESKRENNVWLVIQCQTYGRVPLRKQERKSAIATAGLLFLISSKGSFICMKEQKQII